MHLLIVDLWHYTWEAVFSYGNKIPPPFSLLYIFLYSIYRSLLRSPLQFEFVHLSLSIYICVCVCVCVIVCLVFPQINSFSLQEDQQRICVTHQWKQETDSKGMGDTSKKKVTWVMPGSLYATSKDQSFVLDWLLPVACEEPSILSLSLSVCMRACVR